MVLLHAKHNKTKLSKNCHPYNTRKNIAITFPMKDYLSDGTSKINVRMIAKKQNKKRKEKKFTEVRGSPCKRCSRSQQRSRLAAQVNSAVSLDRTCICEKSHSHHLCFSESALDTTVYDKTHSTHLWQKLQARAIFVTQYAQPNFQECLATVVLNHYRTLRAKTKMWIQSVWVPKTMT